MTKFTSEFIAEARSSITETGVERYICIPVQIEMLDEIERLQSHIAELEDFINQLIEAGETMAKGYRCHLYIDERKPIDDWKKLVDDWKEG